MADARAWSGIGGLREVFATMRGELRTFADEDRRELFDVPDAPLPDPDTPAPVRFLPEFDAPLLAYDNRSRTMTDEVRRLVCVGAAVGRTVLVDGTVAATWAPAKEDDTITVTVAPFRKLSADDVDAVTAEGLALLAFTHPGEQHEVRVS